MTTEELKPKTLILTTGEPHAVLFNGDFIYFKIKPDVKLMVVGGRKRVISIGREGLGYKANKLGVMKIKAIVSNLKGPIYET